ncbi:MAG: sensor domain-containing protein [Planctomycetota bacterium]|nr:sensor domain-containing protein [Planctomycetota bacterium]
MSADEPIHEHTASRDPIRAYVQQLAAELDGCDVALRHDALIDAEVHLRSAVRSGATTERAIADYGAPAEIARAYRESTGAGPSLAAGASMPPPGAPPDAAEQRGFGSIPIIGVWAQPAAWGGLLYFGALGFALAIFYFIWVVTLGSLALGTMPLIIGPPLLVLLLASVRGLSLFEGKVVELLLRVRMPRRTQPVAGLEGVSFWKRIGCWLRDVRSWMSLGYLVGIFPVSTLLFTVTITLVALSAWLLAAPVFYALDMPISQAAPGDGFVLGSFLGVNSDGKIFLTGATVAPVFLMGLALMTGTLWLMRGFGFVYGRVVQAIQVARPQ